MATEIVTVETVMEIATVSHADREAAEMDMVIVMVAAKSETAAALVEAVSAAAVMAAVAAAASCTPV